MLPSFVDKGSLPSWYTKLFAKRINLGTDLRGGQHFVYSIDLDKAVEDKAGEIRRDLEGKYAEENIAAEIKTPGVPIGAFSILPKDASTKDKIVAGLKSDYGKTVEARDCAASDPSGALCFKVSSSYAEDTKKQALKNAVLTVRERIDERGIAEPTVIEKGDDVIVELPGLDDAESERVKDIIKRTAKLEFKVVDNAAPYMNKLFAHVRGDANAAALEIQAEIDQWTPESGNAGTQTDYYIYARNRTETLSLDEAKKVPGCLENKKEAGEGKVSCDVPGMLIAERYLAQLIATDPSFKVPDDRQLVYELVEPRKEMTDQRPYWRSYYVDRAVRLTGSSISNAGVTYDPQTNRPVVRVEFNRYGGRVFGDLTGQIVGKKLATLLDGKVRSAPIINGRIPGGTATITMGGRDPQAQERDAQDLVSVLKTGSLPAPLKEESSSKLGPTLGADAINKTKLSFSLGIALVVVIMVGIYRVSGVISIVAVAINVLLMLAAMVGFGATLTLPGIAALVLTIGMAVDANILIYERIRDELLLGKSVRGAVDIGFSRAFTAILDGQLTTAAAGFVLYHFGSGPIKGFAVMLLVGIGTTLFTAVWASRVLFDWYLRGKANPKTISI